MLDDFIDELRHDVLASGSGRAWHNGRRSPRVPETKGLGLERDQDDPDHGGDKPRDLVPGHRLAEEEDAEQRPSDNEHAVDRHHHVGRSERQRVKQRKHGNGKRNASGDGPKQRRPLELEQKRLELAAQRDDGDGDDGTIVVVTAITIWVETSLDRSASFTNRVMKE